MNKKLIVIIAFVFLCTFYISAQIPGPPEELGKFEIMLGNWEGSGTMWEPPVKTAIPWKAASTVKKILGGHFIQRIKLIGQEHLK